MSIFVRPISVTRVVKTTQQQHAASFAVADDDGL